MCVCARACVRVRACVCVRALCPSLFDQSLDNDLAILNTIMPIVLFLPFLLVRAQKSFNAATAMKVASVFKALLYHTLDEWKCAIAGDGVWCAISIDDGRGKKRKWCAGSLDTTRH